METDVELEVSGMQAGREVGIQRGRDGTSTVMQGGGRMEGGADSRFGDVASCSPDVANSR